ncbi:TPA: hypothetical protein P4F68_004529 [Escherichia coli]|nr:hypothetical protein [Escherichia coli]
MDWYDVKWFFRDVCDSVSNVAGNIYDVAADGVGAVTDFIEENPKTSIAIGTTAAWRLQIVVWQNMSFQSNHPE